MSAIGILRIASVVTAVAIIQMFADASAASARDLVVVEAYDTNAFKPGDVISLDQTITLEDGAMITGFAADGRKLGINGPYSGTVESLLGEHDESDGPGIMQRLADLFKADDVNNILAVGSTRGGITLEPDDMYAIDIDRGGVHCLTNDTDVHLWRAATPTAGPVTITDVAADATVSFDWPGDIASVAWPNTMPVRDGSDYLIAPPGRNSETLLSLHIVPSTVRQTVPLALWMTEKDCLVQAVRLLLEADIDEEVGAG